MPREKNITLETPAFFDEFGDKLSCPELYLMAAILQRALLDRIGSSAVQQEDRRSAKRFFDDLPEDRESLFSFDSIAEHLDPAGDAERFKRRILARLEYVLGEKASNQ